MNIQNLPIADVKPYSTNPRNISPIAIDAVAKSITRYGWQQPIVVDPANVVIVGHTRLKAAEQLGLKEVPVVVADLDEDKANEYRLVDNKSGEISIWDDDLLTLELSKVDLEELKFLFDDSDEFDFSDVDQETEEKGGLGDPIIQYNIVFDNMDQQDVWHGFLRMLKTQYADEETIAARLVAFIEEKA